MEKNSLLTHKALVMLEIARQSNVGADVYFSKLKESFKECLSPVTLSKCIKELSQQGFIEVQWKQLEGEAAKHGNRWIMNLNVSEDASDIVTLLEKTKERCQEWVSQSEIAR